MTDMISDTEEQDRCDEENTNMKMCIHKLSCG